MTAADAPRGTVLAGYRIERLLGRGSSARCTPSTAPVRRWR
ncbi:MAG: hypothetical protein U1F25_04615 [Rubrivivax sp.]